MKKLVRLKILLLTLFFAGCALFHNPISYFDTTSYKNLTDLKPEVIALYDTFVQKEINNEAIAGIRLRLAQIYEYEQGKGAANKPTVKQIKILQDMFEEQVKERLDTGIWNTHHLADQKESIGEAFDLVIKGETLKNKNK